MRHVLLIGLLLGGCAMSAPPYTGTTMAEARWAGVLERCQAYEASGERDEATIMQCRANAEQAAAEDASEREALQGARQYQEDAAARDRRRNAAAAFASSYPRPVAPVPTATSCTSTAIGTTVYTNCH
jgi:hypothetical protein